MRLGRRTGERDGIDWETATQVAVYYTETIRFDEWSHQCSSRFPPTNSPSLKKKKGQHYVTGENNTCNSLSFNNNPTTAAALYYHKSSRSSNVYLTRKHMIEVKIIRLYCLISLTESGHFFFLSKELERIKEAICCGKCGTIRESVSSVFIPKRRRRERHKVGNWLNIFL